MADNTIELALTLDESDVTTGLKNISNDLGKVESSANSAENSLDNAFQTGKVRQYERETNRAATANKRLDNSVKRTTRSQSRNVRATNAATNALSRYIGVNNKATRGIGGLGVAMGATPFGIFIAGFAAASTVLEVFGIDLFGTNEAMNELTESTKKLIEETEKLNEVNEKVAQKQLIDRLKAQGKSIEEIAEATAAGTDKIRQANIKSIGELFDQENRLINQLNELRDQDVDSSSAYAELINEVRSKQIENLEAQINKTIAERTKLSLANQALNTKELQEEVDQQKKRSAIAKKNRDTRKKEEDRLAKELKAIQEKILKEELKTRLELIIDGQQKEIETRKQAAVDQENNINALFERQKEILTKQATEEEKQNGSLNAKLADLAIQQKNLLVGIEQDKQNDIKAIRTKFRSEETSNFKSFLDNIINQSVENTKKRIEIERTRFATQQEIDRATFFQVERTEQEITDFKEGQNEARLRNEKNLQIAILEAILKGGQAKTKLEKELIKGQIEQLKAEVENIGIDEAPEPGNSIFSLLGIDLDPETEKAAIDALRKIGDSVIGELSRQAQERERIAAEQVSESDRQLDKLNANLDREVRLLENGDAANIERQKQAIAEQEAIRKKALEDQKKAQQQQFAIDTASQVANLVTASANIFKNLSAGFPYTLPLAIGAVAAMLGAFAASRASAAKAVGFADGGVIPLGRDDRQNTTSGYRVGDTNMFVGGGEYITPVEETRNSIGLLKAIHKGELTDADLNAIHKAKNRGITASVTKSNTKRKDIQKEAYKEVMREAIKEQTSELGQYLRTLVNKPVVYQLPNGTTVKEYDDGKGNKGTKTITG